MNMDTDSSNTGHGGTGGLTDSAKQAANQASSQAKGAASKMLARAKEQAASRAEQGRQTVASGIQEVAQAFRSMGDDLRGSEQSLVAQFAPHLGHTMAGQVERLGNYLEGRDVRQILADTEGFARRSPAVFLGGAFLLGLAASRILKSSAPAASSASTKPAASNPVLGNVPDPRRALPPASGMETDAIPLGSIGRPSAVSAEGEI